MIAAASTPPKPRFTATTSASRVKLVQQCLRAAWYQYVDPERYDRPKAPANPILEAGSRVHFALQQVGYRRIGERKASVEPVPLDELLDALIPERTSAEALAIATRAIRSLEGRLDFLDVTAVEEEFTLDLGRNGWTAGGYLDRLEERDGGAFVRIVDYKTGGSLHSRAELELDPQAGLYLAWAREHWFFASRLEMVFWYVEQDRRITIPWSQEVVDYSLTAARSACDKLERLRAKSLDPTPSIGGHCARCDYAHICPELEAAIKAGAPDLPATGAEMPALVATRQRMAGVAKAAEERRKAVDRRIRPQLQSGPIKVGELEASLRTMRRTEYPDIRATCAALAQATGRSADDIKTEVSVISSARVESLLKALPAAERQRAEDLVGATAACDAIPFVHVRNLRTEE